MKSLFQIDYNLLKSYNSFSEVNHTWNIASYLNTFYSTSDAIAFAKLFYPDFEVVDECVILSIRYDKDIFESWKKECHGNIALIEKMCNLYEVADYFHINDNVQDNNYDGLLKTLGYILKKAGKSIYRFYFLKDNLKSTLLRNMILHLSLSIHIMMNEFQIDYNSDR